jgi:hypothetical protein
MLSPNAMNRVSVSSGVRFTVTANEHDAVRFKPSVAVHSTDVVPSGNVEPDAGVQDTLTGAWPPPAEGVVNVTAVPVPEVVVTDTGAGQDNVGDSGVGVGVGVGVGLGVGDVGLLVLQAARTTMASATT